MRQQCFGSATDPVSQKQDDQCKYRNEDHTTDNHHSDHLRHKAAERMTVSIYQSNKYQYNYLNGNIILTVTTITQHL